MSTNLHWMNSESLYSDFCKIRMSRYSKDQIADRAHKMHQILWKFKDKIWGEDIPIDAVKMIDPMIAMRLIGFNCEEVAGLGAEWINGNQFEVAGVIDKSLKKIMISKQYPLEVRNFTAAHELGHALLHRETGQHRDRPLNGTRVSRNETEAEADFFATVFLMPEKLIRMRFEQAFLEHTFVLNEATAFALGNDYSQFIGRIKSARQLSRIIAGAQRYNSRYFASLASQFNVSVEAMAIRIEELGLIA